MNAVLDKFGRIVIPKEIRESLGLRPGSALQIDEDGREIRIRPLEGASHVMDKDGWLVYTGALVGDASNALDMVRRERIRHVSGIKK